jgi:hypothetical protein
MEQKVREKGGQGKGIKLELLATKVPAQWYKSE